MKINLYQLSREQVSILKGIAILLITMHNFSHMHSGVSENELYLNLHVTKGFIQSLQYPERIFNSLISFLGHYGVQIFVFCSGYGLTKKYGYAEKINYWKYIVPQVVKLYGLLIAGIIVVICFNSNQPLDYYLYIVPKLLSMTVTWSYQTIFAIVGPYWFFGLIFQLYLLYPFILKVVKKYNSITGISAILAICYIAIYLLYPLARKNGIPLYGNFLGHLPEFILGVFIALAPKFRIKTSYLVVAVPLFIGANLTDYLFPFSFLSATIIMLALFYRLYNAPQNSNLFRFLLFIGNISMFIFIINGPLRSFTVEVFNVKDASPMYVMLITFVHTLIVIAFSYVFSLIYKKTMEPLSQKTIKLLTR